MEGQHPQAVTGDRIVALTIKLRCLPIALLLQLLEQLEAGTGAGQEQPEALPQKGTNGSKPGSLRRQRPPRTELRSQMCPGLLSPPPYPLYPPPKCRPFHLIQVCPSAAAH